MNSFSAMLLAGGKSTRMGRDKAGVQFNGQALWQRQIAVLESLAPAQILISGHAAGPYAGHGYEVIADDQPALGPLSGVAIGLRSVRSDLLLVLAIDLPNMTAGFLRVLLQLAGETGKAVVPRNGRWFEPLAAVYTRACLSEAERCLRGADRSMQHFVRNIVAAELATARLLEPEERVLFKNVNTEADLRAVS